MQLHNYADDITLLGPTHNSVMALLDVCSNYAHDHDIIFNPSKQSVFIYHVIRVVLQEKIIIYEYCCKIFI